MPSRRRIDEEPRMSNAPRIGRLGIALVPGLAAWILALAPAVAAGPGDISEETLAQGQELFARAWIPRDLRSHGGDGLGPVYNERSCLGCHNQGGPGGAAGADKNLEIVTGASDAFPGGGAFYAFGMSFGAAGFQYKFTSNPKPLQPPTPNPADLAQIHAGFRDTPSVVLHRYGPDADYRAWRERVAGPHGTIFIRSSQRNPTPLFGAGLIDAIPDEVIEAAARRRFAGWPQVKGRVSRTSDGRVGRFGWKAQTATLAEFVLNAAAVELGLEVPGHHQAGDPRIPAIAAPGLDMDQDECDALVAYVRSLPSPASDDLAGPKEVQQARAGGALFKTIGCATCHLPRLGEVEGIYSDLLLHDMGAPLADTSVYGIFAARDPVAAPAPAPGEPAGRKPRAGAAVHEWRTPPLWGLRGSAPYLHDGRAETLDQAIRGHGGQAAASAQRYTQLSARERAQLEAFLLSLAAPAQDDD
jgi:CxxC motif-containing protein (DUF1111 family)